MASLLYNRPSWHATIGWSRGFLLNAHVNHWESCTPDRSVLDPFFCCLMISLRLGMLPPSQPYICDERREWDQIAHHCWERWKKISKSLGRRGTLSFFCKVFNSRKLDGKPCAGKTGRPHGQYASTNEISLMYQRSGTFTFFDANGCFYIVDVDASAEECAPIGDISVFCSRAHEGHCPCQIRNEQLSDCCSSRMALAVTGATWCASILHVDCSIERPLLIAMEIHVRAVQQDSLFTHRKCRSCHNNDKTEVEWIVDFKEIGGRKNAVPGCSPASIQAFCRGQEYHQGGLGGTFDKPKSCGLHLQICLDV